MDLSIAHLKKEAEVIKMKLQAQKQKGIQTNEKYLDERFNENF